MENELPTLAEWEALLPTEQETIARALGERLAPQFRWVGIESYALGDQRHAVALYEWDPGVHRIHEPQPRWAFLRRRSVVLSDLGRQARPQARFAFLPGGALMLGYDASQPFVPTEAQRQSWEQSRQDFGLDSLEAFLAKYLTSLRRVLLSPVLMEVRATEVKARSLVPGAEVYSTSSRISRRHLAEAIARDGFRFPTSDEWEYACAAGARTLFRWGDTCPLIDLPQREEAPEWDLHLRPNAFGLTIADWPYHWEYCLEPGIMRGGDGGSALHAGVGTFAEWLTLASAFWCPWERDASLSVHLRRVYPLE